MDWKEASAYYEARLIDVLAVYRYAIELAKLPQADVPPNLEKILLEEFEPAKRQLERLRKREFRIAVVGLEKAGKSTFLNAWLGSDLLPSKAARCTFTTTQIYSVESEAEQRLEIQAKTDQQFSELIEELTARGEVEDLKTIQQNGKSLSQVRRDGNLTLPFTRLEDIKEQLIKYVADERYAHAVLQARLYTSKLAQAEGIVFYDVPGSDSGLAKHVDEARQMLSDCDAVILVQRDPSLKGKQLEIIKFTDIGDKNVSVSDKLFVFLSRIDSQGTPEALEQVIEATYDDWKKRAALPQKRIIPGSAGAYLVLSDLAGEQTKRDVGAVEDIRLKLRRLTGIEDDQALIERGTGIPEIKKRIFNYIDTERVDVLKKRCDASIAAILDTSTEIYNLTRKRYSVNPEEAKKTEQERQQILFSEWWNDKWEQIKADLQVFYDSSVINDASETTEEKSSSIDKFKQRYLQVVKEQMEQLRRKTFSKKDRIFAANSNPGFDRANANFRWREDLYGDMSETLSLISIQLAMELQNESLRLIDYMSQLLWGSEQVKVRLLGKTHDSFLFKLENGLSVLFMRFARPVAEALLRGPVDSDIRKQSIQALGADIEIIDNYYSGEEAAFRVLKKYAKYGFKLLFESDIRQQVLGTTEIANQIAGVAIKSLSDAYKELQTPQDSVAFEVENDLAAFEEYLCSGIFEAAGFESYCVQELQGLVDSFRAKEGTWTGVALNEWRQENPKLLSEIPDNLRSQEVSLEVSERLRELSVALQKTERHLL